MIPFISNTLYSLNIRLGNNPPNQNMHMKHVKPMSFEQNAKSTAHSKRFNEVDEYFNTCFDKNYEHIESKKCQELREAYEKLLLDL